MPSTAYTLYDRMSRPMPQGKGKIMFVLPSGSALISQFQQIYTPDPDGFPRVFENDLAAALALTTSGRGDTIYVAPGSYTVTSVLTIANNDVRIIGMGATAQGVQITGVGADIFTLTGDYGEIANVTLNAASAQNAINMTGADGWNIHDNILVGVGGANSRLVRMVTTACNNNKIQDNWFMSNLDTSAGTATQVAHIAGLGSRNQIQRNVFQSHRTSASNAGATTSGIVFAAAGDVGNKILGNYVFESGGATFTAGIDYGTSAGEQVVMDNRGILATAANFIVNGSNSAGFGNNAPANGTV